MAVRVQPSHGFGPWAAATPGNLAAVEWPEGEKEPTKIFSATCRRAPPCAGWCASPNAGGRSNKTTTNSRRARLGSLRRRSWNGWHHHVTLVMAGALLPDFENVRRKKNFWVDPAEDAA